MQRNLPVKSKVICGLLLIGLVSVNLSALEDSIEKQVTLLLQDKKFLSAYRLLERFDTQNVDTVTIRLKAEALLHGMVRISDTNIFYLRDGIADSLNNGSVEGTVAFHFPLQQVLEDSLVAWPKNSALWAELGSFHFLVFRNANNSIDLQDSSAAAALDAYQKSMENGATDAWILGRIGILYTWQEDLEQAVSFLQAALVQEEDNSEIQYDLAYALYLKGEVAAALPFAQFAQENIKSGPNHLNATLLLADIELGLQEVDTAALIYEELYTQDNNNRYALRRLIECNLINGDTNSLDKYTRIYIESNPSDVTSFYRLTNMFLQYQKPGLLISIAHSLKAKYQKTKPEMAGLLSFYEAMLYAGNNQSKEALVALNDAKKFLFGVYADDHPISQQIRELNQRLR